MAALRACKAFMPFRVLLRYCSEPQVLVLPCRQKNGAAVSVTTAAPLSGNLIELVGYPCAGYGLSPSVDRHAVTLQSQRLLRSFCLSVSGHVAPSAAPAGVDLEPSPAAETG